MYALRGDTQPYVSSVGREGPSILKTFLESYLRLLRPASFFRHISAGCSANAGLCQEVLDAGRPLGGVALGAKYWTLCQVIDRGYDFASPTRMEKSLGPVPLLKGL